MNKPPRRNIPQILIKKILKFVLHTNNCGLLLLKLLWQVSVLKESLPFFCLRVLTERKIHNLATIYGEIMVQTKLICVGTIDFDWCVCVSVCECVCACIHVHKCILVNMLWVYEKGKLLAQ